MSKFYICTAIPYVNDKAHIGHAIGHLYADTLARYHRQIGDDVLFNVGTDEHGEKIAEAAKKQGLEPKQFTDQISNKWIETFKTLGISYDSFIRTTDEKHEKGAAQIWQNLSKDIYKKSYKGMYCVGCEEFKTDTYVKDTNGVCPLHNRPYDEIEEENYFFALSKYTEQIKQAIQSGDFRVVPQIRKNEILSVLEEGLQDISVSRRADKVSWGIPVPNDPDQVMYVWFEALMNYITTLGYPDSDTFKKYWPADVQVIGKDILRFHAAIWPGMLFSLGIELPKTLDVHGHVAADGQKMSKSLGNVIDPIDVVNKYGQDAFRYFFLRYGPTTDDSDFTWSRFNTAFNSELADQLGNAVQRVSSMIGRYFDGSLDIPAPSNGSELVEFFNDCRFDKALDFVWTKVKDVNQYIDDSKPWELAKQDDKTELSNCLAKASADLLQIAEWLVPLLPDTAAKIKAVFTGQTIKAPETPLFPKLDRE